MPHSNIRIVSEGHGYNTQVYCEGVEIKGVISVDLKIQSGKLNICTITVAAPCLELLQPKETVIIIEDTRLLKHDDDIKWVNP